MQCKDMPWMEVDSAAGEFMTIASEGELVRAMKHIDELAARLGSLHKPTKRRLEALSIAVYRKGCERFGDYFGMPF